MKQWTTASIEAVVHIFILRLLSFFRFRSPLERLLSGVYATAGLTDTYTPLLHMPLSVRSNISLGISFIFPPSYTPRTTPITSTTTKAHTVTANTFVIKSFISIIPLFINVIVLPIDATLTYALRNPLHKG